MSRAADNRPLQLLQLLYSSLFFCVCAIAPLVTVRGSTSFELPRKNTVHEPMTLNYSALAFSGHYVAGQWSLRDTKACHMAC